MSKYQVIPLSGFNDISFGMSRSQVHTLLGSPNREFFKSKYSKVSTDDYGDFHIFYDKENSFEAVEFFEIDEVFDCKNGIAAKDMLSSESHPYKFNKEDDGFIDPELSIGIYAPHDAIESVLFGAKNYY